MSGSSPPYSVTLSFDNQENDDRSEVSWSSGADGADGNSLTQGFSIARLIGGNTSAPNNDDALLDESDIEQATNSSRGQQSGQHQLLSHSAHQLSHSAHQLSHSAHQLSSSRGGHRNGDHQTLSDTCSMPKRLQKRKLHLERKVATQKEKLDILSTKLRQSNAEKDVLKAEKASLIDELTLAREEVDECQQPQSTSKKGFARRLSLPGFTSGGNGGGSMKMLLDTNAKLMTENARLQVSEGSIRKSFQSHVRYCNRLHQRNEMLQHQLNASKNVRLSISEHTGRTAFSRSLSDSDSRDDFIMSVNIGSSQHSEAQDSMLMNSLHSIPEKQDLETTDDDWSEEGEDINNHEKGRNGKRSNAFPNPNLKSNEYIPAKDLPRSKSNKALLVEFGNVETRRGRSQSSASWAPQSSGAAVLSASNHSLDVSYSENHHYQDEYHHEEDLPLHDISQHSAPEMMTRTRRTRGGASWSSGLALGTRMFKKTRPSERVNPNPYSEHHGNRYEYNDNDTNNMPLHDASQHSHTNRGMMDSLHSIPEKVDLEFGSSYEDDEDDTWTVEDKELEEDLDIIEGGNGGRRHNTSIATTTYTSSRRSTVPPAGVSPEMNPSTAKGLVRRKSGPLLVDFGELGRSRSGGNDDDVDHHGDYDDYGEATTSTGGVRRSRSVTPSRPKNSTKKGGWSSLMGLNRSERSGVSLHVK